MSEFSLLGKSIIRPDAKAKVLGKEEYSCDTKLPGMLHSKVLGSPYPHAKILSIDTSEAERVPGVRCVVTNKDASPVLIGAMVVKDLPIMASGGVVRYMGEPVAAVAAKTLEAAEEAVDLIRVTYEELPAVFDVEEAAGKNPPVIIHPEFSNYRVMIPPEKLCPERPNVFVQERIRKGEVDKGFEESDLVLENRYVAPSIQHCALEPHSVVVRPDHDGGVTLFSGKQAIWTLKGEISGIFGIEQSKVRVKQRFVGGAFGGKVIPFEYIPTMLALKTGRPVKWVMTREEVFVLGGPREGMVIYVKDGMKRDGILISRKVTAFIEAGAYAESIAVVAQRSSSAGVSLYRMPHFEYDAYGVYTNTPKRGGLRGFGANEIIYAIECNMDLAARELGIDPVEFRRKNMLKEGEPMLNGEITHSIGAEECMDGVVELIKGSGKTTLKDPWRTGWGLAIGNKFSTAPTLCGARIKVTETDKLIIYHGADAIGQGVNIAMAQIAAESFGVSIDHVDVVFSNTETTPFFGNGSTGSRVTFNLGNAVLRACEDAKQEIYRLASWRLDAPPEIMETRNMEVYVKTNPEKKIRVADLFMNYLNRPLHLYSGTAIEGGEIMGKATFEQPSLREDPNTGQLDPEQARQGKRNKAFFSYVAKAVEVAVNIETGQVKILSCYGAVDLGKAINPKVCEQQSEGGMVMGIGSGLYEETMMDQGRVINPNFTDYRAPLATQMPLNENMKTILVESAPHKDGPFGAKGYSEGVVAGMEAAIANAVHEAAGVRIKELPITPEKVLKALNDSQPG
jgi:CO/xanthine dehydrogenase Mo-binding subunit